MGSILAIDYGLKRIGLAISDPSRSFAFPCKVIENNDIKNVLVNIGEIINEKEVDLVLVGMPFNMNGTKSKISNNVEGFVIALQKNISIPVKMIDERLSSFIALENLKESQISTRKSRKGIVDIEAARLLLEEYLEKEKPNMPHI